MESRIFRFITKYSLKDQLQIVVWTLASFPILYLSLELPKVIINDALSIETPDTVFFGYEIKTESLLLSLCVCYLAIIIVSGLLKMRINTLKGIIGERLVRRLRYQLTERILRFHPSKFQSVSQGELISTVTAEAEPLAGYIGDSIALPLFQGGTMLTILAFMFVQSPVLGVASILLIPLQLFIIPRLQKKINLLKKERVKTVRHFSERIGETVDGAVDIRIHGTERYHQAEFSSILGTLFNIRLEIFKRKYFMKFLNNFINSLTPIMFYSVGGILVIRGEITVGALVAAIAAHKDLTTPWRELLNFYQIQQDAKIRYEQILMRFQSDRLRPEIESLDSSDADVNGHISGDLELHNVILLNEAGDRYLTVPSMSIADKSLVSISSQGPFSWKPLAFSLSLMDPPYIGQIRIGGRDFNDIPRKTRQRRVSYAGPDAFLFNENVAQNINYGLRQIPPSQLQSSHDLKEALASGNSTDDFKGVWTDLSIVGMDNWVDMRPWFESCIYALGAGDVVYRLGLNERPVFQGTGIDFSEQFMNVRLRVREELYPKINVSNFAEFDFSRFCPALMILENITFGLSSDSYGKAHELAHSEKMRDFLKAAGLYDVALQGGQLLAKDIYRELVGLEHEDPLPLRFSRFDDERIRKELLQHFDTGIVEAGALVNTSLLIELFLRSCFASTIVPLISGEVKDSIVAARKLIRSPEWSDLLTDVESLDENSINSKMTILENVLFGRLLDPDTECSEWLHRAVEQIMIEEKARSLVLIMFSMSKVGIRGANLPIAARQRIQLLRALIKKPDILIFYDALSAIEDDELAMIFKNVRALLPNLTIITLGARNYPSVMFDQKFEVKEGVLTEVVQENTTLDRMALS